MRKLISRLNKMDTKLKNCWILFTVLAVLHAVVFCAYLAGSDTDLFFALANF